ncbi:helix-turn-helix transcriptional regulator [Kitasatospora herbaricolor]|uniref:Helix-turn-helix transcriptional regulator n=1 Tax=Kitasatospora herbaricolor TaxID=68217 RepID=A0ABZ1W6F0_9ACTN|nr:helix-turn-helix transcriptional regulator [Kitasatospora herbaricolor]
MRSRKPSVTPVPFSPMAARAHRAGLGLTPHQVAEGMAAHGVRLLPTHVIGWETGEIRPSEEEFIALARALWCPPAQLMGARPACLRDFRVARELGRDEAARRIGLSPRAYDLAEDAGRWTGDEDQTYALAQVLGMTLREVVAVLGRGEELDQRLRRCVDGRWQAQVKAVGRIVPVPKELLAAVLTDLQNENQVTAHWGSGGWGSSAPAQPEPPQQTRPLGERFWELLSRRPTEIPV